MRQWLQNLSANERRLLLIGGVLVTVALLWVMVYKPVTEHINQQVDIKQRLTNELSQMQTMLGSVANNPSQQLVAIPSGVTFSSWVDQQLRLVNLQDKVNRTEPIDQNSISVWLQGVSFDQVIDWIQMLSNTYSVTVDQIDVNVVDPSLGLTNIRMRLVK